MDRRAVIAVMLVALAWIPGANVSPQLNLCGPWYHCWPPLLVFLLEGDQPGPQRESPSTPLREHPEEPTSSSHTTFGYGSHNGPGVWHLTYPECGGSRQSPVDLDARAVLPMEALQPLLWSNYWVPPSNMSLANNGHTVMLSASWEPPLLQPAISGGPLAGDYVFEQLHFHWGPEDSVGSEHTVNNLSFPMEMHAVHYKRDYGSFQEALRHRDGVAVVAFLFVAGERDNPALGRLVTPMQALKRRAGSGSVVERPFPLALLKPRRDAEYVTYSGSLTTPPCSEVVTWIIGTAPLRVSRGQLSVFRDLSSSGSMDEFNYRPVQPLNHRLMFLFR
ncbi:carbonic anhydrase 2-like [Bacillus rossius redtenbacheri]|uniref:carbonic anhydrase 2-like n=1 Tax=Bacillus rossius redtenbacheri TaxID=93214 RepID=UPI002FDD8823